MGPLEIVLTLALHGSPVVAPGPTAWVAVADTAEPSQLVALLTLRRENLPHGVRGEIYPVAALVGDSLVEAVALGTHPFTGEAAGDPNGPTPLDRFRDFTVYHDGRSIGRFEVDAIETAVYSCSPVRVGLGRMELPDEYVRFGRFDPRVVSLSISGSGFEYEYTLNWYLALARPVDQPDYARDTLDDPAATARLEAAVWSAAIAALDRHDPGPWRADAAWGEPRWSWREPFRVFDLDGDGRLEGVGAVEIPVAHWVLDPNQQGPAQEQFFATAIAWVEDAGPGADPGVLLVVEHAKEARHWDFGHHLAEVADLDGDGVAEILYQVEGWEYHGFQIYRLRGDRLERAFSGAAYGC